MRADQRAIQSTTTDPVTGEISSVTLEIMPCRCVSLSRWACQPWIPASYCTPNWIFYITMSRRNPHWARSLSTRASLPLPLFAASGLWLLQNVDQTGKKLDPSLAMMTSFTYSVDGVVYVFSCRPSQPNRKWQIEELRALGAILRCMPAFTLHLHISNLNREIQRSIMYMFCTPVVHTIRNNLHPYCYKYLFELFNVNNFLPYIHTAHYEIWCLRYKLITV